MKNKKKLTALFTTVTHSQWESICVYKTYPEGKIASKKALCSNLFFHFFLPFIHSFSLYTHILYEFFFLLSVQFFFSSYIVLYTAFIHTCMCLCCVHSLLKCVYIIMRVNEWMNEWKRDVEREKCVNL